NDGLLFDSSPKDLDGANLYTDGPSTKSKTDNQERPNAGNSTKDIDTVEPSINTASSNINTASLTVNTVILSDYYFGANSDMRSLDKVELDISNLSTTYLIPTTLNTRINKDYSLDNVIGDMQSGVQKRRIIVTTNKQGFISAIYEEKTHGCTQEEGIDYDEVFALVARSEAIRLFLAHASFIGFLVYQMDVKSAFLYGRIEEEVYVCQPLRFEDTDYPDKVYKVEKALYGLHQAPRAWYETLAKYLLDNGFHKGEIDQTLFINRQNEDILLVQVSMIESLMYLTSDQTLCLLYVPVPNSKYLKGHPKVGLLNPKDFSFDLVAYTDSDYAGASLDRKSTSGGCLLYPKDFSFDLVAYTDSDYAGASLDRKSTSGGSASCCGQVLWIQNQQLNYGISNVRCYRVPTASEESCHCQKKREATAEKIALLLMSRRNCQLKSDDSYAKKGRVDGKLAGFKTASKDIDNLLESQRLDKNNEGLGYSDVPPPPAQIYSSPKKDMSWTGLPEFKDDTVTDYSRPAPTVESSQMMLKTETLLLLRLKHQSSLEHRELSNTLLSALMLAIKANSVGASLSATNA
nr:putative ribonuclease H-like domain-containing protein [Tanacetum cinerariifolium]